MTIVEAFDVEVFFDGACRFCSREIAFVSRMDTRSRVRLTDISKEGFDPQSLGKTHDEMMARIHARLPDGTFIEGVEVFRRIYAALGFGPIVALTRVFGVSHALNLGYTWFAKNRVQLGGKRSNSEACSEDKCTPPPLERRAAPVNH